MLDRLSRKVVGRLDALVETAEEAASRFLREGLPRPSDVIAEHFPEVELSEDDLRCLAEQFCGHYDRPFMPSLFVHDALHVLLEAPPTAMGEAKVMSWQAQTMCLDPSPLGFFVLLVSVRPNESLLKLARIYTRARSRIRAAKEGRAPIGLLDGTARAESDVAVLMSELKTAGLQVDKILSMLR